MRSMIAIAREQNTSTRLSVALDGGRAIAIRSIASSHPHSHIGDTQGFPIPRRVEIPCRWSISATIMSSDEEQKGKRRRDDDDDDGGDGDGGGDSYE